MPYSSSYSPVKSRSQGAKIASNSSPCLWAPPLAADDAVSKDFISLLVRIFPMAPSCLSPSLSLWFRSGHAALTNNYSTERNKPEHTSKLELTRPATSRLALLRGLAIQVGRPTAELDRAGISLLAWIHTPLSKRVRCRQSSLAGLVVARLALMACGEGERERERERESRSPLLDPSEEQVFSQLPSLAEFSVDPEGCPSGSFAQARHPACENETVSLSGSLGRGSAVSLCLGLSVSPSARAHTRMRIYCLMLCDEEYDVNTQKRVVQSLPGGHPDAEVADTNHASTMRFLSLCPAGVARLAPHVMSGQAMYVQTCHVTAELQYEHLQYLSGRISLSSPWGPKQGKSGRPRQAKQAEQNKNQQPAEPIGGNLMRSNASSNATALVPITYSATKRPATAQYHVLAPVPHQTGALGLVTDWARFRIHGWWKPDRRR
ncbi:uncharacterized protein Triagg1_655 [Trichoderma aggressivum f. europaeum]|uniref:Uncharacterized protein n=1 Tax=Trichoderma aggressivum f. europaeum TaxID=173218 RepID=A0AAE1IMC9_9HYPO|nr:hypothetical protein Triagg1_655 [Trichoderma aggressivum f. europaeum]